MAVKKLLTLIAASSALLFTTKAFGSDFDIAFSLTNGGFEFGGNQAPAPGDIAGCPFGWTCGGSPSPGVTGYQPTNQEFPNGVNGLGFPAPDGSSVALCPTFIGGSCILSQNNILTIQAGTTYTLTLWVGTPAVMPFDSFGNVDDKSKTARTRRITFYWVGTGNAQFQATDLAPPPPGQWTNYDLRFTPTLSQIGQPLGIMIFASSDNYGPVAFDIAVGD